MTKRYKASISLVLDSVDIVTLNAQLIAQGQEEMPEEVVKQIMGQQLLKLMEDIVSGKEPYSFAFEVEEVDTPAN